MFLDFMNMDFTPREKFDSEKKIDSIQSSLNYEDSVDNSIKQKFNKLQEIVPFQIFKVFHNDEQHIIQINGKNNESFFVSLDLLKELQ